MIKEGVLNPLPTDKLFADSPDTGRPTCLCSRCGAQIQEGEMPIRLTTTNRKGKVTPASKEYRYCEGCTTGIKYFFCEPSQETGYKCSKQCEECKAMSQ
jgi:hypothetical protein